MIQKNTLLAAISFFSILCSAQTQVGINTTDPKATLDIAAKTDGSTQPEGILIPRLTGEQIKNMPVTASQNSMMVYATLAASPASGIAVNITEPGYYYYQHDAATPANSIWVKVITNKNNEWVYDAATNRINLKRSGTSPFLNTVYYDNATGKFVNKTNTTRNEFDNDLNAFVTTNVTDTGVGNFNEKGSKDLAALAFLRGTQTYHSKTLSENSFYFNDEATASNMHIYANKNNLVTAPSNLADVRFLMASSNSINKSDPKTAIYMAGANNSISINDGNVTEYATATRSEVYLNSPGGINNASSVINFSTVGPRLITTSTLSGVSAGVNYLGNATGGIENAIAYNAVHTINKTFNPFITNLFGYRYLGLSSENTPTNIQNHYGLYLHNIDKATNNWGIYTNAGKNSFGDQVQIRTINANTSTTVTDKIVVADADGVLKTRDASAFNANAWSLTGNAGTTAGTNFIGTTDDQPLMFKVNNIPYGYLGQSISTGYDVITFGSYPYTGNKPVVNIGGASMSNLDTSNDQFLGSYNTAVVGSSKTFYYLTTGSFNNVLGSGGVNLTTGSKNTIIGSADKITTGNNNVVIGGDRLYEKNATGSNNVVLGSGSLYSQTTGSANLAILGGNRLITGDNNLLLKGDGLFNGSNNIMLNSSNPPTTRDGDRQLNIGDKIVGDANDNIGIGSSFVSTTNSLTDAFTPGRQMTEKLEVDGSIKLLKINSTAYTSSVATDKVVVADADGVLKTKDASALSTNAWSLTGNASTTAGTNFIGTTDDIDVVFKRQNAPSGLINKALFNTSFGYNTLRNVSSIDTYTGKANTAIGYESLRENTTGALNVGLGSQTLVANTTGAGNVALGAYALARKITGDYNIAIGSGNPAQLDYAALGRLTDGTGNVSIGSYNMTRISSGTSNTSIGFGALFKLNTGRSNIAIGNRAGENLISGDYNLFLGVDTYPNISVSGNNQINIGNTIFGYNNKIGIGNSYKATYDGFNNITTAGLTPTEQLEVDGSIKLLKINSVAYTSLVATDKVVVADANGVLRAKDASAVAASSEPWYNVATNTGATANNQNIYQQGNVGIKTNSPTNALDVAGNVRVQSMPQKGNSFTYSGSSTIYNPTKTVIADNNGVLGTLPYIPELVWTGSGWKLLNGNDTAVPTGYGLDLSYKSPGYPGTWGAIGGGSIAIGGYPVASGIASVAINDNTSSGIRSMTWGGGRTNNIAPGVLEGQNIAANNASTAFGINNTAKGVVSTSFGIGNTASDFGETSFGTFGTLYTPITNNETTATANSDRLLNVGNGTGTDLSVNTRSDAFTILKNGKVGIDIDNFETTTSSAKLQVNGDIQSLTINTSTSTTATDKVVVADANGVLKTKDASAVAASAEPWYNVATNTGATANTQDIYQMGKVGIGIVAPNSTLQVAGSMSAAIKSVGTYTATASDYTLIATGGAITLPNPATCEGRMYHIVYKSGTVTITNAIFVGGTSVTDYGLHSGAGGQAVTLQSDGSSWYAISRL